MARIKYLILAAVLFAAGTASAKDKEVYKDPSAPVEARVEDLLGRMTLYEKVAQLSQYTLGRNDNVNNLGEAVSHIPAEIGSLIYFDGNAVLRNAMQRRAVEESRLGIPVLFGYDVIHGFRTVFQIPLGQAASWQESTGHSLLWWMWRVTPAGEECPKDTGRTRIQMQCSGRLQ